MLILKRANAFRSSGQWKVDQLIIRRAFDFYRPRPIAGLLVTSAERT